MIRSHVIRLDPTCAQEEFFWRCTGTARFAYNWALRRWREKYTAGEKFGEGDIAKELNAIKREQFPWMLEVPKTVVQQAIKNLGRGYQNFFNSVKGKRKGPKMAPPDWKSKRKSKPSAKLDNGAGTFSFDGKSVKLPMVGRIKTFEELRLDGKPLGTCLSFQGGRWWLSVQVELPDVEKTVNPKSAIGIDLGLTTAVTLSNGEKFEAPKPLKGALKKLRRMNKSLHRKVKGSQNREKAKLKLSRLHFRIGCIRKDWIHKLTTSIAKRFSLVCVEGLNIDGMMANHKLSRAISDIGWGETVRQLKYKADAVQEVGTFYPSSKTCYRCGHVIDKLSLSDREWTCPNCGKVHDRDENAALNIREEGIRLFRCVTPESKVCGVEGSGPRRKPLVKPLTLKQKLHLALTGKK